MTAPRMTAAIDAAIAKHPAMKSFKNVQPRRWVSTRKEPIREVIHFAPARHEAYFGNWGFALSFCPSLNASNKLAWKRTEKATRYDLWVDCHDNPPFDITPYRVSYSTLRFDPLVGYSLDGTPEFDRVKAVVERVVQDATHLFDSVKSYSDLAKLFEIIPSRKSRRFGPDNYVPHGIAWGLTLLAAGNSKEGLEHIERWRVTYDIDPTDRILLSAIAAARDASCKPEYLQ